MVFHLNNLKNIFRPLFCHFWPNSAILRSPIFSGHEQFFGASFELVDRKFGHLATVVGRLNRHLYVNKKAVWTHRKEIFEEDGNNEANEAN
jgi:hypothetical protein